MRFYITTSKLRVIGLFVFCILLWKFLYFISKHPTIQSIIMQNNTIKHFNKVSENKIIVSVYYEALCSDSRNFILKQLVPAYEKASNLIELDLIPYGKAMTIEEGGTYKFECQHSYIECEANKVHACVLNQPNLAIKTQLQYVACMIRDNMIPHEVGRKCAEELNIDYDPINECAKSIKGSKLLRDYGVRTHAVSPKITFIPTIQLNKSSKVLLVKILKNLLKEVCNFYEPNVPNECI